MTRTEHLEAAIGWTRAALRCTDADCKTSALAVARWHFSFVREGK